MDDRYITSSESETQKDEICLLQEELKKVQKSIIAPLIQKQREKVTEEI